MTPEQTIAFIKILNHHEILSFSDENLVALDLESGAEVKIRNDGSQLWFLNGKLHRTDGPAEILSYGTQLWFRRGEPSSEGETHLNGKLHRTDGPAKILADGSQFWLLNGQRHREDGPAEIWADGAQRWWLNGEEVIREEHTRRTGR